MVGWGLLSIVGLTAGAGMTAFLVARQRAEPDAALTRVIVVRPIDVGNSSAAYTHEFVSVLARHDGRFNFVLPPEDLSRGLYYPFPRPSDESDSSWPFRVSEGAQPSLDQMPLKQGQLATAQVDGQLKEAPGVQADLLVDHGALTGIVTNRTGGRLSDAYIVVDGDFRPLGSLEKDQSSQIDFLLPPQAAAGNLAATAIADKLTPPGSSGRQGASARRDWLESLFSARFLFARMELRGPTLVGWLEQAPNQIMAPDFRLSSADFTLLVQPLQPQLPIGFEGEVPAAAMNRRDLGIGSGTIDSPAQIELQARTTSTIAIEKSESAATTSATGAAVGPGRLPVAVRIPRPLCRRRLPPCWPRRGRGSPQLQKHARGARRARQHANW